MLHRPRTPRKGIAATEMALLAPVVMTLLMGLWEVGRYVSLQNILDNAAREGGRLAASGSYFSSNNKADASGALTLSTPSTNTNCELQQRVLLYLTASGLTTTNATVTVANLTQGSTYTYTAAGGITGSGFDPSAGASQLDQLSVTVTMPYKNGAWSPLSWFVSQSAVLTASSNWNSMVDVPLTVSTTIPSQPLQSTDPLP